ncbi:hypothetical protein PAXINDRAFT_89128, partial [Paxillus involutus ATCC 200175]
SRVKDCYVLFENSMRESSSKKERATKHARTQTQGNRTKLKGVGRNVTEDKGLWKLEKNAKVCSAGLFLVLS